MMVSPEWERFYAAGVFSDGTFPHYEKLVRSFVGDAGMMLELGAGNGCEIPFFTKYLNFGYRGVDGSPSAVERLHQLHPELADRIKLADFTKEIPFEGEFDLIAERASIPHNDLDSIRSCLALVYRALKPGGIFISSDWFSTWHSEFARGEKVGPNTRAGYPDGQFKDIGTVHFSDEAELVYLFKDFEGIFLQERMTRRPAPNGLVDPVLNLRWISPEYRLVDYRSVVWDIVVRKPL